MIRFLLGILMVIIPFTSISAGSGKKPQWVVKGGSYLNKQRSNSSYYFKVIYNSGPNLTDIRNRRVKSLSSEMITKNNDIVKLENLEAENTQGGSAISKVTYRNNANNRQEIKQFYHMVVDEYSEWSNGAWQLYTLFAVSEDEKPIFDHFSTTTSYGAGPAFMSIIPGVGQMYKGSTLKGICMLGGVAACSLGALFCENERSDYKNKIKEQPQFAQTYNTKANNYETARNICIGAAAAIWLYNIIDAAVAKGARKIIVSPNYGSYLSIHPVAAPNSAGVSLTYNF